MPSDSSDFRLVGDVPTTNTLDGPEGVEPMCVIHANEWIEDHR